MVRELLRRPSVAVASWGVLVLALFAWRGDLGLSGQESVVATLPDASSPGLGGEPVVVRRKATAANPDALAKRVGRVFDSMGFLLVGAEVVPIEGRSQKTDAAGSFEIELMKERATDLLVRAEGRRGQWCRTSAISPDPLLVRMEPIAPWDAEPQPPTAPLALRGEGTVAGPDGQPLPFAFVNVLGTDCWGKTDDIGRVVLPLPSRRSTFVVHRPGTGGEAGVAAVSTPFASSRARGVVPLPPLVGGQAGAIEGIVRDESGQGVAGLPVEVRGASGRRFVETGAGGSFVLTGLVPDDYIVEPFAYRGAIGEAIEVRVDRAVVACDLSVRRVEEADLRVVTESGAVAAGVWVAASLNGMRRGVAQANGEGLVSLPIADAAEFDVRRDGSYASCEVRAFDASAEPATIVIAGP